VAAVHILQVVVIQELLQVLVLVVLVEEAQAVLLQDQEV
jgi:hypothetical protein